MEIPFSTRPSMPHTSSPSAAAPDPPTSSAYTLPCRSNLRDAAVS